MEQKKTLWITLGTGIFLLVVLGAAIILYAPQAKKSAPSSTWISPAAPQAYHSAEVPSQGNAASESYLQGTLPAAASSEATAVSPAETQAEIIGEPSPANASESTTQTITADNVTVYAQGTTSVYGTTIDLNNSAPSNVSAKNDAAQAAMDAKAEKEAQKASETKTSSAAASTATAKSSTSKSSSGSGTASGSSSKSASSTSAGSGKKTTSTGSKSGTTSKSASSAKSTPVADTYWVQVASYTTKKHADEARAILEAAKLPCEVFTFTDKDNKLYYRVRVGPYTTLSEAKYWQAKIVALPEFKSAGTYITNSSAPAN